MEELNIDHFLAWKKLSKDLKELKETEAKARRVLVQQILGEPTGAVKEIVNLDGFKIVAQVKINRSLDLTILNAMYDELNEAEKNALKYKPTLVAAKYKMIPKDSLLHDAVIDKLAMPSLTVE